MLIRNMPCRRVINYNQLSNVGVTAAGVKEYFEVSAYRNILDMINTFEGVLNRWGMDLHDQVINIYSAKYGIGAANSGYAISKSGNVNGWSEVYIYARKNLNANGLKPLPPTWNKKSALQQAFMNSVKGNVSTRATYVAKINNYKSLKGAYFSVGDLLNLARNLNWELNRVRLPIPHNFRQINEKIQGRNYKITPDNTSTQSTSSGGNFSNYINLMDLINVYGQLKSTMNVMRNSIRKEIDAANLARKVQEETLRREQEALISRQAAEKLAEENRIKILAERKAALEKEFLEADEFKKELMGTRTELEEQHKLLEASKQGASDAEVVSIEAKQAQIIDAIDKIEAVAIDKDKALNTAKEAAKNVNNELIESQKKLINTVNIILTDLEILKNNATQQDILLIEEQQKILVNEISEPIYIPPSSVNITLPESKAIIPETKDTNLVPILLTVAAGMILT